MWECLEDREVEWEWDPPEPLLLILLPVLGWEWDVSLLEWE